MKKLLLTVLLVLVPITAQAQTTTFIRNEARIKFEINSIDIASVFIAVTVAEDPDPIHHTDLAWVEYPVVYSPDHVYKIVVDISDKPEGNIYFYGKAKDHAGNESTPVSASAIKDTVAPMISITITNGTTITIGVGAE